MAYNNNIISAVNGVDSYHWFKTKKSCRKIVLTYLLTYFTTYKIEKKNEQKLK